MTERSETVAGLARATGISYQGIKKIYDGKTKTMGMHSAESIAKVLQCNKYWLANGEGEPDFDMLAVGTAAAGTVRAVEDDGHPDLESIRVMKLRLRAGVSGFAAEPDEDEAAPIYFRSEWLKRRGFKPYNLVATRVGGQSMEPTLYQDDLVVAHTQDCEPKDGEVYSINYEGEPVIKRLVRDSGEWWLASDNPDKIRFPNKRWVDGSAIIIGRIVHRQSERI